MRSLPIRVCSERAIWEGAAGGNDTIRVRDSYAPGDVTIAFVEQNFADTHLRLTDTDGNTITVNRQSYSSGYEIEQVVFGDSTVWDLSSMEIETHGTSGNDSYLYGHDTGDASSDDTIYGYEGNDFINGGDGDDLLYGGDGADTIYAITGHDIAHGGDGNDTLTVDSYGTIYGDDGDDYVNNSANWPVAATTSVAMYGGDGADTLVGGYGTNLMNGGAGADSMTGHSGSPDIFQFDGATAFSAVDTISQFYTTDGDKLDIADIWTGQSGHGCTDRLRPHC